MARKIIHIVSDDLDGSENAETVSFSIAGKSYEIDLAERNRAKLDEALAPYIKAARRAGSARSSAPSRARATRDDLNEVRAWAKANGYDVADRGRISQEVLIEYDNLH
jgi:hypothetical protein